MAFLRLRLEHVNENHVPDREGGSGLGVTAVELPVRDDAFALGADVDQDLIAVDPDDGPLDDIAMLEAADVGVLFGEELLHRGGLTSLDNGRGWLFFRLLGGRRIGDLRFGDRDWSGRFRGGRRADRLGGHDGARLGGLVGDCDTGGLVGRLVSDGG